MTLNLKIALITIIAISIFIIVKNIKQKKLQLSFSVFWIITGSILIIALLIPSLIEKLTDILGFEIASNMLYFMAIFVIFYLIFSIMIIVSGEYKKSVNLIQEVSILKKKIENLEEQLNERK